MLKTGRTIPYWEVTTHFQDQKPVNPALWREDDYFREAARYTGRRPTSETIVAGYAMAQGRFGESGFLGRTGYVTGVRTEKTETEGTGYVRTRVPTTAAERLAD